MNGEVGHPQVCPDLQTALKALLPSGASARGDEN
jgi:hypothetical protein